MSAKTSRRFLLLPLLLVLISLKSTSVGAQQTVEGDGTSLAIMDDGKEKENDYNDTAFELLENDDDIDGMISLSFSIWKPPKQQQEDDLRDDGLVEETILEALLNFFCQDVTDIVVLNANYNSICSRDRETLSSIGVNGDSSELTIRTSSPSTISNFLSQAGAMDTYLREEVADLFISSNERDGIEWESWQVFYHVVYIGTALLDQAEMMNFTHEENFLQDVVQLALDVSIMEGTMDARMEGTGVKMSMVGLEDKIFQESDAEPQDDQSETTLELDGHLEDAKILRAIGFFLILFDCIGAFVLTRLGRRRRLAAESKALLDEEVGEMRGLETEQSVNRMLDESRKQSIRMLSQSKKKLDSSYSQEQGNKCACKNDEDVPPASTSLPLQMADPKDAVDDEAVTRREHDVDFMSDTKFLHQEGIYEIPGKGNQISSTRTCIPFGTENDVVGRSRQLSPNSNRDEQNMDNSNDRLPKQDLPDQQEQTDSSVAKSLLEALSNIFAP